MRMSASGAASNAMRSIKERKELYNAKMAISAFHDALLGIANCDLTPEQVKDFFFSGDPSKSKYYGDVLNITPKGEKS